MKQVLCISAASLAVLLGPLACSNPNGPGQNDAAAPPPPSALFAPTPGDTVQSPGNYAPSGNGPYRGN